MNFEKHRPAAPQFSGVHLTNCRIEKKLTVDLTPDEERVFTSSDPIKGTAYLSSRRDTFTEDIAELVTYLSRRTAHLFEDFPLLLQGRSAQAQTGWQETVARWLPHIQTLICHDKPALGEQTQGIQPTIEILRNRKHPAQSAGIRLEYQYA